MGSPFADLYGTGPAVREPESPFSDLYGPSAPSLTDIGPSGPLSPEVETPTAAGIAAGTDINYKQNVEGLKALLQRPDISAEQRSRVERLIHRWEEPTVAGFPVGNRQTEVRTPGSNFARGIGAGAINYGILGASDLVAGASQLVLPKVAENLLHIPEFRERIADAQTVVREWFDPQGHEGGAGTVVGALAPALRGGGGRIGTGTGTRLDAALEPFAVLNTAGFKAMARVSPKAAAIVAKGTKPGATFLQRLAAQVIGTSTVDAVQVADVLTHEGMTEDQKIQAVVFTALASGGSAGAAALRRVKPTAAEIAAVKPRKIPEKPEAGAKPERGAEAEALVAKAGEAEKNSKLMRRLNRAAQVEWEQKNPDADWSKVPKDERAKITKEYRERYAKTNISPQPEGTPGAEKPAAAPVPPETPAGQSPTAGAEGATPPIVPERGSVEAAPAPGGEGPAVSGAPEPPVSQAGRIEPQAPSLEQPAPTPVDLEIAKLQQELVVARGQRDEARREAETDNLTGLGNQRAWARAITAADADPTVEIALFDLQNMKAANDILGYQEGSSYIVDAARAIETAAQANDAGHRVFRYGGDEFGVIVPKGKGQAVVEMAKQILGVSAAGEYQLGIRGALANTVSEADAALGAVKRGETHAKSRKIVQPTETQQSVPGVELKKPLAQHTVAELDKLYDQIDNLFAGEKINESAYANGILAISEAKRQLKKSGVDVESLRSADKSVEKPATAPKADQAAKKDAGYRPEEKADPKVNEGFGIWNGTLQPITRAVLEDIKTFWNKSIADASAVRDRVLADKGPDQLDAARAEQLTGTRDHLPSSKAVILTDAEKRIRAGKDAIDRFTRQHARYNDANPSAQPPPRVNPADPFGAVVTRKAVSVQEPKLQGDVARKLFSARLDKMPPADLEAHRADLAARLSAMHKAEAKSSGYAERLAKVQEEIATRANGGSSGITLQTHPAVTSFAAGFAAGLVNPTGDEQRRFENALYMGALFSAGTVGYLKILQRARGESLPDYQKNIRSHVKSVEDAPLEHRKGIYARALKWYGNIARRDIGITAITKVAGGGDLPAGRNPGKLAELFGLWRGMSDRWLFGDKVGTFDRDGEWVQFDAKTMQQIAGMVDGDLRTVGDLAAARRELELRTMPEPRTTGLHLEDARKMYANTSEKYHAAAAELTKFFRAMKDYSVMSGLLSQESSAKMDEQTLYVAVRRLFGGEPGTQPGVISTKGSGKKKGVQPENLFRNLKGNKLPYQNPVEAAVELLPRYLRAGELNRLATEFFDMLSALESKDRSLVGRRLSRAETPKIAGEDVKVQQLRDELSKTGSQIGEEEARAYISAMSDESLNITSDVVRFFRDGKMEAWRVSEPIARAFRSLQPHELEMIMAGAGILTKPTNLARVGITGNPVFIGYQAFRDMWQYHMNGTYAVEPDAGLLTKVLQSPLSLAQSGIYSVRGWAEIMFRTGEYRKFLDVGTGGESVASQGLQVIRGDVRKNTDLLTRIKEKPSNTQFGQIINEIRTGNVREAYASLMQPIADAGRVGAYLKERGRGHDVIEAVYRAKKAGANFSNKGDAALIQGLNRITLFLNPAIQGVDASRHAFQKDPMGWAVRGIAGITLPSMYLWAAYKDDEEITQLRGTPTGKKFWFFRLGGTIVKLPKPILDGQIFGSSMESYLDARNKQDPDAMRNWTDAILNDAAVNLLPFVGVVPISLATGKIVGLRSDITPPGTQGLDVEYQAKPETSTLARIVSREAAPMARAVDVKAVDNALSPAGIDFLIQTFLGGSGTEAAKLLSIAVDVQQGGMIPPKEELPIVRSVFGRYPTLNTNAILEFYTHAERAEKAANTAAFMAKTKPADIASYLEQRRTDIAVSQLYAKARNQLADLRKAVEDIRQAPRDIMGDKEKRDLTEMLLRQMIENAKQTNDVARSITQVMEGGQ